MELGCDLVHRAEIEVTGSEYQLLSVVQVVHKASDQSFQFPLLRFFLCVSRCSQAIRQLLQYQIPLASAALLPVLFPPASDGRVSGQASEKSRQDSRPLIRHGIPGCEPGVVDAFLRVLIALADVIGNSMAVSSVFLLRFGYGPVGALPIQIHNGTVFHAGTSFVS